MSETIVASRWYADKHAAPDLGVRGAALVRLHAVFEERGALTVGELGRALPFAPRRFFVVSRVPGIDIRGEHAHRELRQFLVCLAGSVFAEVDDGERRRAVLLDCAQVGLALEPMVWGAQSRYSKDAVLLVLASREYDPADYIREYDAFVAAARARPR
jgi:dTDP-4-dehydrorhamnose 3,5-epimerase-like enzyme